MKRKTHHKIHQDTAFAAFQVNFAGLLLLMFIVIIPAAGTGCTKTTKPQNTEPPKDLTEQQPAEPAQESPATEEPKTEEPSETNKTDDTKITILTEVGRNFSFKLPSNPTTGYSWQLMSLPPDSINLLDKSYKQDRPMPEPGQDSQVSETEIIGAGGFEIWTFRALKTDSFELLFEYRRPWEKNIPAENKKIVKIEIK